MSHITHEQLPTPRSYGQRSGGSGEAPKRWASAAALLTLALGQVAQAADGQLDPSFDGDGRVTLDVENAGRQDQIFGVAILDGRIVVGGSTRFRSQNNIDFVAARFTDTGTLDPAFGTAGLTTTDIGGPTAVDFANALVLQTDQGESKIVLVGYSGPNNESPRFAAVRYRANGAPDTGFGGRGR
ncbi:MAG: delta-60 repeat domain-containing protein [Gammaproteobacteria bacterium]